MLTFSLVQRCSKASISFGMKGLAGWPTSG
jgi:hypothetical protein